MHEPTRYSPIGEVTIPSGASKRPWVFEDETTLREYWITLRKHATLIASLVFAAASMTMLVVFVATPEYTASAKLMLERSTPQVLDIRQVLADTEAPDYENEYYKTQYALLANETIAAQVIRELRLQNNPLINQHRRSMGALFSIPASIHKWLGPTAPRKTDPSAFTLLGVRSQLIANYLSHLDVQPVRGTNLVTVSFTAPDPELAAEIVNAHVQAYVRQGLDLHRSVNEEAQHFLEEKLVELKERVEKSEAALNAYGREQGIVSLNDNENIAVQHLQELNKDLVAAEAERISLEAQTRMIHRGAYESLPAVIENEMIQKLQEELVSLQGEYARLSQKYKPGFKALDAVGAQVAETRARLRIEIESVVDGIQSAFSSSVIKESEIRAAVEQQKALALRQKDAGVTYGILSREADTNRQLYDAVLQRMKETGVAAQVGTSNVFIVVKAVAPTRPSAPTKSRDILISFSLALFTGVAIAFMIESFDPTFKSPQHVENYLAQPVLALIPDFGRPGSAHSHFPWKRPTRWPRLFRQSRPQTDVTKNDHFPHIAESYRRLRSALVLSPNNDAPQVTLFTSAVRAEGKTLTSVNLACTLSQLDVRVLLIDADLRRPRCHDMLGRANYVGLSQVLAGVVLLEQAITDTALPRLWLLPAGPVPPNPAELVASRKMQQTLLQLRASFDYIVVDSPPTMIVSDALPLSRLVDGSMLVVNAKTPRTAVAETCARLTYVGGKILGIVLNQVDLRNSAYSFGSEYRYYQDMASYKREERDTPALPGGPSYPRS